MGKIPSSGVTKADGLSPTWKVGGAACVVCLRTGDRPIRLTLGSVEGAISRSPSEPSQAFKPDLMTDSCMADIIGV
jgi:hypothetical protein